MKRYADGANKWKFILPCEIFCLLIDMMDTSTVLSLALVCRCFNSAVKSRVRSWSLERKRKFLLNQVESAPRYHSFDFYVMSTTRITHCVDVYFDYLGTVKISMTLGLLINGTSITLPDPIPEKKHDGTRYYYLISNNLQKILNNNTFKTSQRNVNIHMNTYLESDRIHIIRELIFFIKTVLRIVGMNTFWNAIDSVTIHAYTSKKEGGKYTISRSRFDLTKIEDYLDFIRREIHGMRVRNILVDGEKTVETPI